MNERQCWESVKIRYFVLRARALKALPGNASISRMGWYWAQIIIALAIYSLYPVWWAYLPLIVFISTRQYALATLLHEAQHSHLHANKSVNNWLGRWLVAAPLGSEFSASQKSHLTHHFRFGTLDGDPDYNRYCLAAPAPKGSAWGDSAPLIGKLLGGQIDRLLGKCDAAPTSIPARIGGSTGLIAQLLLIVYRLPTVVFAQLGLLAVFIAVFGWWGYLGLWVLPLATLASFYDNFRVFCEHSVIGRDADDKDGRLITFTSNPVERFFFAPSHMNYHAEHHLFAHVPQQHLPVLHDAIMACPELSSRIQWRSSYCGHILAYFRQLNRSPRQPIGADIAAKPIVHRSRQWA
jgi:fatty acid desaturase